MASKQLKLKYPILHSLLDAQENFAQLEAAVGSPLTGSLLAANNLSDVASITTARANLLALPWSSGYLSLDAGGNVTIGQTLFAQTISASGTVFATSIVASSKSFLVDHPVEPDRYLVHGCLEGPEHAVFYRGAVTLSAVGDADVYLPEYFTALTDPRSVTVQVSVELQRENEKPEPVGCTRVVNGAFTIKGSAGQCVAWEATATRKDVRPLIVEPRRREVMVRGQGPYKYSEERV